MLADFILCFPVLLLLFTTFYILCSASSPLLAINAAIAVSQPVSRTRVVSAALLSHQTFAGTHTCTYLIYVEPLCAPLAQVSYRHFVGFLCICVYAYNFCFLSVAPLHTHCIYMHSHTQICVSTSSLSIVTAPVGATNAWPSCRSQFFACSHSLRALSFRPFIPHRPLIDDSVSLPFLLNVIITHAYVNLFVFYF